MKLVILVLLYIGSISAISISPDNDFLSDEIIERINSLNTTWKAGKNFDGLSLSEVKKAFMSSEEIVTPVKGKEMYSIRGSVEDLKGYESFDSRKRKWTSSNRSSNCTSIDQIFDQGLCSPSWIYASVGQIADRLCILTGEHIDVVATIEYMLKDRYDCNSGFNSADMVKAFQYWKENGIVITSEESEKCLPLSKHCDSLKNQKFYKVNYYQLKNQSQIQLNIFNKGPITFLIDVYVDLLFYKSGVYQRTSNVKLGSHVVKCIGWGVENGVDYWLLANSWGTKWGEDGFFKIKRGEGDLEIRQHLAAEFDYGEESATTDRQKIFISTPKKSDYDY